MKTYFTTTNGDITGTASYFFKAIADAQAQVDAQNIKATALGIVTRYSVASTEKAIDPRQMR